MAGKPIKKIAPSASKAGLPEGGTALLAEGERTKGESRVEHLDCGLSPESRASTLLKLMNVDEKIGQLTQLFGWKTYDKNPDGGPVKLTDAFKEEVRSRGVGSLYGTLRADPWTGVTLSTGLSPREGAEAVNVIQKFAMEASRLRIPILFGEECSHGHMAIGATVFPVPLSMGSMWDVQLYKRICRAVALETRVQGGAVTYSPVLDVVRDPRWGRTEECYGEDPYLAGEMAAAAVTSMQGERLDDPGSLGVTLKHFAAYGASEGGRNGAPARIGPRELHEIDLPPFRKGVQAGALSIMPAYNEIDGVPCTSNRYLLTDVLRRQWGFDGFVITDCGAIDMLANGHQSAEDGAKASALALRAGIDMEMSGSMFGRHLKSALDKGLVSSEELDEAVLRVLKAKFRLGLFERPYADPEGSAAIIGRAEHRELARRAATEGTVLLKNERGTLPLRADVIRKIAVVGPNADRMYNQLGDYTSPQARASVATVLDGIVGKLKGTESEVLYAPGCSVRGQSREGFERARAAAEEADVTVLVLGGSSARDFGEGTIDLRTGASVVSDSAESDMDCGEGIDRVTLRLSGVQLELAQHLKQAGKPLVVVYINGRPIVEPWIDGHADAILEAWYPGQEGGNAIADLLFGDSNPSGKLTITIPRHEGQLPLVYNNKRTRGKRYLEYDLTPQYPFGHGLSYTSFAYSPVRLGTESIAADETTHAAVTVTNTGDRAGAEVVQLYVTDVVSSYTRPERELKGFCKVFLEPGESAEVSFPLGKEALQITHPDKEGEVEPGLFVIGIGGSSVSLNKVELRAVASAEAAGPKGDRA